MQQFAFEKLPIHLVQFTFVQAIFLNVFYPLAVEYD